MFSAGRAVGAAVVAALRLQLQAGLLANAAGVRAPGAVGMAASWSCPESL